MRSPSFPESSVPLGCEDGEPLAAVSGIDFSPHVSVTFEARHQVCGSCRAQQHPIRECRHPEALIRCIKQCDEHVELGDRKAVAAAQLRVEGLHHGPVQQHQRAPRLPFVAVKDFVIIDA